MNSTVVFFFFFHLAEEKSRYLYGVGEIRGHGFGSKQATLAACIET